MLFTAEEHMALNRAVAILQAGGTREAAAAEIGKTVQTLRFWMDTPTGRQIVNDFEHDLRDRTNRLLVSGQAVALRTLLQAMTEADRWSDRIRAATAFTQLQERTIVVTGPNGGPIEVAPAVTEIMERVANIRARNSHLSIVDADVIDPDD